MAAKTVNTDAGSLVRADFLELTGFVQTDDPIEVQHDGAEPETLVKVAWSNGAEMLVATHTLTAGDRLDYDKEVVSARKAKEKLDAFLAENPPKDPEPAPEA